MKYILPFLLLLSITITGCGKEADNTTDTDNEKLNIYTTVYPLQYFTEEIGKEFVEVNTIYPPGADEHTFEPSQKDMIKLADSDLFIFIGLGLEGFVNKAQQTLANEDVILLPAGENIHFDETENEEHEHADEHGVEDEHEHGDEDGHEDEEHNHGDVDPHVWIDPLYAKELALAIKKELIKQLPEQEQQFEENYSVLEKKLNELHTQFEEIVANAEHREFIVSHAAYGYWETRYGLEQISVSGLSSSSEPTQKELEKIVSTAKEHDLHYVFFEQNISSKLTEIVQKEMNAKPLTLHNLSVLTDEDIKNNRTYFSIMEDNLKALETALAE